MSFYIQIITFAILSIISILTHTFIEKYIKASEQLLVNRDFSRGAEGWEIKSEKYNGVTIHNGEVRIQSFDAEISPNIAQKLSVEILGDIVLLKATAKSENISVGKETWHKGRILFMQYRQSNPINSTPHQLASLHGTEEWKQYSKAFHIQPAVSEARVVFQLKKVTGVMSIKEVSLIQVNPNRKYVIAKWVNIAFWISFFIAIFYNLCRTIGATEILKKILIILTLLFIVVGTTIPQKIKNNLMSIVEQEETHYMNNRSLPVVDEIKTLEHHYAPIKSKINITKWTHFILFALLTFVLLLVTAHNKLHMILINVFMLACGTEIVQLFIENRGASLSDVMIDMVGSIVGLLLWFVFTRYLGSNVANAETRI